MATFIGDPGGIATDDEYFGEEFNIYYGLGGNDIIVPIPPGPIIMYGGDGNDELASDAQADELYGGRGDDTLYGVVGNDLLEGGSGDDTLYGGRGAEVFYGGPGGDVFGFDFADAADRIHDFERKQGDSILMSGSSFAELEPGQPLAREAFFKGKSAKEKDDHVGYDRKSGKMFYDENGDSAGGRILPAQFDKGTAIKFSDIDVSPLGVG